MQVPDPGLDHVNDLKIQCSDVFFFESQLRSDHFGSLHNLENLKINYCKLRSLPPRTFVGLRSLKNLGKKKIVPSIKMLKILAGFAVSAVCRQTEIGLNSTYFENYSVASKLKVPCSEF